ncbi:MAG: serine hydrolase, partial [Candidatus Limnocylindria bacterium]
TTVATAMRELLLEPLALDRIIYQDDELATGPVAIGLTHLAGPAPLTIRDGSGLLPCRAVATAAGAAGGMAGDAESLARWVYLLHASGVLQPDSLRALKSSDGHGFGSARFEVDGKEALGHPGLIPGYRGILAYLPSLEMSCAVLVNTDAQDVDPLQFLERLVGALRSTFRRSGHQASSGQA